MREVLQVSNNRTHDSTQVPIVAIYVNQTKILVLVVNYP